MNRPGRLGMHPARAQLLGGLTKRQFRTVSQLGTDVGTRPTTLTGVLDRLERRGHITRGTRAGDRRSVLIELTPSGRTTAAAIRETITRLEERALADLSPAAVAGFHAVLEALTAASS